MPHFRGGITVSSEPDEEGRPRKQRGWIVAAAPLAAIVTALGVFFGPVETGLFNLHNTNLLVRPENSSSQGGAAGTSRPPLPSGTPPSVDSSGTRAPTASIPPAPPASESSAPMTPTQPASPHITPSHGSNTRLAPSLAIVVRNTPSDAGVYQAPLKLTWSPIVTLNGRIVTHGCSIYWTVYFGSVPYSQTSATPCDSSSVNELLLPVGEFRLVGKVVIDSAVPATASVPIPVGP